MGVFEIVFIGHMRDQAERLQPAADAKRFATTDAALPHDPVHRFVADKTLRKVLQPPLAVLNNQALLAGPETPPAAAKSWLMPVGPGLTGPRVGGVNL